MNIEHHTESPDIKAIRLRLKVNQHEFAEALGLSLETIKSWEQGRRNPTGLAQKVLKLIDKDLELYYRFKFN
ncbi:helix-turn-helix domain-containing protein [Photobacterium sp. SDRW27]|uniref:NadS family protein n=1 Tax=Photobacterium obscurum TaxID=2829490 RepID=UPI0022435A9E|nr:NadS family protein [Photobacterium obscurum]MCW8328489.1 helix-turn-helix domain-containing protein [Photobacterium obscurum]